jgi:Phosphofructokinase
MRNSSASTFKVCFKANIRNNTNWLCIWFYRRLSQQTKRILGIITVGEPACGMNAAMRAFVRFSVTHGFKVLGIQDGFIGLLQDQVNEVLLIEQRYNCMLD